VGFEECHFVVAKITFYGFSSKVKFRRSEEIKHKSHSFGHFFLLSSLTVSYIQYRCVDRHGVLAFQELIDAKGRLVIAQNWLLCISRHSTEADTRIFFFKASHY
jgi:hypothetical protein